MEHKPRLLLLGASYYQIPAIIAAHKLGYQVIALDKNPQAVANEFADEALNVDIIDIPNVIEIAKEKQIQGVFTMQSDIAVPTVGAVNDQLGLSGISYETACICSDKVKTRKTLQEVGVLQPKFKVVSNVDEAGDAALSLGFPCIVKSPDSSGSRGVTKVKSADEVESAFIEAKLHSRLNNILVEEFIEGIELGAQTFSVDGQCVLVLLHNDTVSSPPYMIPIGHSFPIELDKELKIEAEKTISAAVIALGIHNGPSNVDLILGKDGKARIIEIGARIGATCLPELVCYHTGIDWIMEAIRVAMGENPNLRYSDDRIVAARILEAPEDGILGEAIPDMELLDDSRLLKWEIVPKMGESVSKLRKGPDRIGKVIGTGDSVKEAEAFVEMFHKKLILSIETEN